MRRGEGERRLCLEHFSPIRAIVADLPQMVHDGQPCDARGFGIRMSKPAPDPSYCSAANTVPLPNVATPPVTDVGTLNTITPLAC